ERAGLRHVTTLHYLRHDLQDLGEPQLPARATLQTYDAVDAALFHNTLLRTYEQTLDCPELNGARTIEEIIAGHQAQGEFDARRWWLAAERPEAERPEAVRPAAVLLVTKVFGEAAWDLSYVGVVPQERRRGWGRALTQLALRQARAAQATQLTLA